MNRLRKVIYHDLGHRGLFMLLLGLVEIIYGAGLLTAAGTPQNRLHWWPGSVGSLGGYPLDMWGIIWVVIGALCLLTAPTRADRVAYAAAALLNTGWAAFAAGRWLSTGEPGAWAPAAIYAGIAAGILLISGWPEPLPPPQLPEIPPPPTPEELDALARLTRPPEQPPP